jgi:hypothetical protein
MQEFACSQRGADCAVLEPLAVWADNPRHAAELYRRMAGVGESGMTVCVEREGRSVKFHVYLECVPEICVRFLSAS